MGIWCFTKLETTGNPKEKNSQQLWHRLSIYSNRAYFRQLKKLSMVTKFEDSIEHWSIVALKFFKENLSMNFGSIAVFVKVTFEITKRAQHCALPWFTCYVFVFFKIVQVDLRLAGCKVYEGHVQNQSGRYPFLGIVIVRCDWLRSNQHKVNSTKSYWRWVEVKHIFHGGGYRPKQNFVIRNHCTER